MDKLDSMFALQDEFTRLYFQKKNLLDYKKTSTAEKRVLTNDIILGLYEEVGEVRRSSVRKYEPRNLLKELVDVSKYDIELALLWNYTPSQFHNAFVAKTKEVAKRHGITLGGQTHAI